MHSPSLCANNPPPPPPTPCDYEMPQENQQLQQPYECSSYIPTQEPFSGFQTPPHYWQEQQPEYYDPQQQWNFQTVIPCPCPCCPTNQPFVEQGPYEPYYVPCNDTVWATNDTPVLVVPLPEAWNPPPPTPTQDRKAQICLDWLRGTCVQKRGGSCTFAHPPLDEVRAFLAEKMASRVNTDGHQTLCPVYALTGFCKFGNTCRDSHRMRVSSSEILAAPAITTRMTSHCKDLAAETERNPECANKRRRRGRRRAKQAAKLAAEKEKMEGLRNIDNITLLTKPTTPSSSPEGSEVASDGTSDTEESPRPKAPTFSDLVEPEKMDSLVAYFSAHDDDGVERHVELLPLIVRALTENGEPDNESPLSLSAGTTLVLLCSKVSEKLSWASQLDFSDCLRDSLQTLLVCPPSPTSLLRSVPAPCIFSPLSAPSHPPYTPTQRGKTCADGSGVAFAAAMILEGTLKQEIYDWVHETLNELEEYSYPFLVTPTECSSVPRVVALQEIIVVLQEYVGDNCALQTLLSEWQHRLSSFFTP